MKIRLRAFALVREMCGFEEKELTVSEGISVRELFRELRKIHCPLTDLEGTLMFAINEEYCDGDAILADGDTLAIFPPVSGG
jgi:molybdopterin synthase sulfur carrier subunit